jgi:hypothetical protein
MLRKRCTPGEGTWCTTADLIYRWHEESERDEGGEEPVLEKSRESRLRTEIRDLKRLLVEKTLEADFFEGALQKIGAQRREG